MRAWSRFRNEDTEYGHGAKMESRRGECNFDHHVAKSADTRCGRFDR
jgi:hypothetical protein